MIYTLIYRLAIAVYTLGIRFFSLFNYKAKLFINGRKNLIPRIKQALAAEKRPVVWVHCASLGEFEQGRPLLEAIRLQYPQYALLLTFFSPSGYEVRKNYVGADYVFYLPVDNPGNARFFLDAVNPKMCLFIKYELWYYYLKEIAQRKIPAFLVSAVFNEQQGFFKCYGALQRNMLRCFTHIFVQDENSHRLLKTIGLNAATVSGDTRFDRVIKAANEAEKLPVAAAFSLGYKVLVAGSTWPGDEEKLYAALQALPPQWRMIIVPHNVDKAHIAAIGQLFRGEVVRWSEWEKRTSIPRVLLVDTVGQLMAIYQYGRVAYIGGGFGKAGVHNVLEPAVYGLPCLYGPIFHQFIEAGELSAAGAAIIVKTAGEVVTAIKALEDSNTYNKMSDAAKTYTHSWQGATGKVMEGINAALYQGS